MIHISKEKHTKYAIIIFQTPLNYWGNWVLFYSDKKVSVNPYQTIVFLGFVISSKIYCHWLMKGIVQKKFEEKLNYLLKQKLRYNGEFITLTTHVTILTYLILILLDICLWKSCRWGITDSISPSRDLWHKAMLEHINVLGLKEIEIGIYTYCKNKDFLHVKVMVWKCHSCQLFQQYGDIKSQTYYNIVCNMGFYAKD